VYEANGVVTYSLSSSYLSGESRVQVLRPKKKTNRVLYLLPVTPWPGFEEKWDRLGSGMTEILKHDFQNRFEYTVVVPDVPEHMPWFVDHDENPRRQHESYMMNVLIPFTDSLPDVRDPVRDLAGFSKAGFGSLSLLLRHPGMFHAASAWDPGGVRKPYSPENTTSLGNAAGSKTRFEQYQLDASIEENAAHFRGHIRIAISGYSSEAFLQRLRTLRGFLGSEQVSYLYSESAQAPHRWHTGWMEQALESLQQMQD